MTRNVSWLLWNAVGALILVCLSVTIVWAKSSGGGPGGTPGGAPAGAPASAPAGAPSVGGTEGWEWRLGAGGRAGFQPCHWQVRGRCLLPGLTPAQRHTLDAFAACQQSGIVLGHVFTDGRYYYGGPFSTLPAFRACMDRWEP